MHVYLASNGVKKLKIFSIRQANNVLKNETNMFEKYLKRVDTKDSTGTGIYESTKMCDSWYVQYPCFHLFTLHELCNWPSGTVFDPSRRGWALLM